MGAYRDGPATRPDVSPPPYSGRCAPEQRDRRPGTVGMEESVSLAEAIRDAMQARGLHTAEVSRRLGEGYDRATFYRLLSGATSEPRLGTLIGLCRVLEISPTELLELAGLWPYRERTSDPLDVRLRDAFSQLQVLPLEDKRRAVTVVACIAESWHTTLNGEEKTDENSAAS